MSESIPPDFMKHFDQADLVMCGAAYYLGRTTIAVDDFCNRLVRAWDSLPEHVQDYIQRIVDEAFRRDDISRENLVEQIVVDKEADTIAFIPGRDCIHPLGNSCDRASWQKVRYCWALKTPEVK